CLVRGGRVMNGSWRSRCGWFLCAAALAACGDAGDSKVAQIDQRQNVIPNTGFVPYPILTEEVEPENPQDPVTVQPVLAPDGSHLPAWDGSVAELMAADAYADCQWSATNRRSRYSIGNVSKAGAPSLPATDQYLEHLKSLMEQFTCEPLSELDQAFSTFPE